MIKNPLYFFLGFLFSFFRFSSAEVENLKILDDIIISNDETKILSLDDYFTNSNLKFSITNPFSNIFTITLSESFNSLQNIEIVEYSNLMRVKNIESIRSFVLLFENTMLVIHWEQINSLITTNCAKTFIYSDYHSFTNPPQEECSVPKSSPFTEIKCHDVEEIFLKDYHSTLTYLVLDCDVVDPLYGTTSQEFFYYTVLANDKNPIPHFDRDNSQTLDPSSYLNNTRKLLYDNSSNVLYRYSPYSTKETPENYSILQYFSHDSSFKFSQGGIIPNTTQYLETISVINDTILILDYQTNMYIFNTTNKNYTDTFVFQTNEINIQISYYEMRLFVLTNANVYRLTFSDQLTFIFIYQINITTSDIPPQAPEMLTQTVDYLYLLYNKYIKIMKIDDSSKKMLDSSFFYDLPSYYNHSKYLLKFPDLVLKNAFSIWILQDSNSSNNFIFYYI